MIFIATYCPLHLEYTVSIGASFTLTDLSKLKEFKVNLSQSATGSFIGVEYESVSSAGSVDTA